MLHEFKTNVNVPLVLCTSPHPTTMLHPSKYVFLLYLVLQGSVLWQQQLDCESEFSCLSPALHRLSCSARIGGLHTGGMSSA